MRRCLTVLTSFAILVISSCGEDKVAEVPKAVDPLIGTWKLIDGTVVEKTDTVVTDYTRDLSCIKIISPTHFAFFQHDLSKGTGKPVFVSGGGRYTLTDSFYVEHLEYCSAREWEGNDFKFTMTFHGDTLIQRGVEKIEAAGVDRLNTERYIRVK